MRLFFFTMVVEVLTATVALEGLVWLKLHRVIVWPPAMVMCATLGDVIAHYMSPFALREYICCLSFRALFVNLAVVTVPWWPHGAVIWPTLLQAAVHAALLAHAPRQDRLMRARWAAQLAQWERAD